MKINILTCRYINEFAKKYNVKLYNCILSIMGFSSFFEIFDGLVDILVNNSCNLIEKALVNILFCREINSLF